MTLDLFKSIETSLGINPKATKIAVGGFVVLAMIIGALQALEGEKLTFWQLLAGMVGLMVFMLAITSLPLLARRLLGWVVTVCLCFIALTATLQTVTNNLFSPPLSTGSCIMSFYLASTCGISPPVIEAAWGSPVGAAFAQDGGAKMIVAPLADIDLKPAQDRATVFVQFAGYPRDEVAALSTALVVAGWPVEDPSRGGERIASAEGLSEVRYFNPGDAALAAALAEATASALSDRPIAVVDLSESKYGKSAPGHLELWISE